MQKSFEFVLPITPPVVSQGTRYSLPNSSNLVKLSRGFHDRRSFKHQKDNKNDILSINGRRDTMMTDAWSDQFNTSNELFNQSTRHIRRNFKNTGSYCSRCTYLRILLPLLCGFLILGGILTGILVPVLNMSKTITTKSTNTLTTSASAVTTLASTLITSISTTTAITISSTVITTTTSSTTSTSVSSSTTSISTTTTSFTTSTSTSSIITSTTENTSTLTTETTTTTTTKICLSNLILLTSTNETIYGIWNTTTGSDSALSTPGTNVGNYWPTEIPQYAFDRNTGTKYTNFGACTSSGFTSTCGLKTGVYLTLQRGASLLLAIQFRAANDNPDRDPLTITIEGSNQSSSALMFGSSWSLIYNGSTGLSPDPGRYTDGIVQYIPSNIMWYTSYRILVTSKRYSSSSVQCGEITMLGY